MTRGRRSDDARASLVEVVTRSPHHGALWYARACAMGSSTAEKYLRELCVSGALQRRLETPKEAAARVDSRVHHYGARNYRCQWRYAAANPDTER